MIKQGEKALDFELYYDNNKLMKLSHFKGKKVVLYFYPKDNTPGCTKEACSFRDVYDEILDAGAVVIGISKDSIASHKKFRNKNNLPFYLLSDPEHKVIEAYGAWQEKKMYGRSFMGIVRSTYVIDEDGIIKKIYKKVKPADHGGEILEEINKI